MATKKEPLFLVYDADGVTSSVKKIRSQSGTCYVVHNGLIMSVVQIGYESIDGKSSNKPIYKIVGEYALTKTL